MPSFVERKIRLLAFAVMLALVSACGKDRFIVPEKQDARTNTFREKGVETRRTVLFYCAGFNTISSYIEANVDSIALGYLPQGHRYDNQFLVFSKFPSKEGGYARQTSPALYKIYKNAAGEVKRDTLLTMPVGTVAASAETFGKVLNFIKDNCASSSYGVIFSSHATGWMPKGYYTSPWNYDHYESFSTENEPGGAPEGFSLQGLQGEGAIPYADFPLLEGGPVTKTPSSKSPGKAPERAPLTKSVGQENDFSGGTKLSYEIDFEKFAEAIPMKLDYIIFDACLMGGAEVAYSLKDKCDYLVLSPAEILAEGMYYGSMGSHLLEGETADLKAVCEDTFRYYDAKSGDYRSVTISLVDCSALDGLAKVCADIFGKYRANLESVNPELVQRYYRMGRHWFYDLKDIAAKAGATDGELAALEGALDRTVVYKAATKSFIGDFDIKVYSGLSMYLPSAGSAYLNNYYRTLSWNKATGLVL